MKSLRLCMHHIQMSSQTTWLCKRKGPKEQTGAKYINRLNEKDYCCHGSSPAEALTSLGFIKQINLVFYNEPWRLTLNPQIPFDLQFIPISLPDSLPIFELLVSTTDEVPQLCVGVRESIKGNPENSRQFDIVELNNVLWSPTGMPSGSWFMLAGLHRSAGISNQTSFVCASVGSGALKAVKVTQIDRDTVLIALESRYHHVIKYARHVKQQSHITLLFAGVADY